LTMANPSLESWLRSAVTAGSRQLGWWPSWAFHSGSLRADVSHAVGHEASGEMFWSAMATVRERIAESFEAGVVASQQAEAAAAARAARPPAPPPPPRRHKRWIDWDSREEVGR